VLERPVQQIVEQVSPGYYGAERAAAPAAVPAQAPEGTGGTTPGASSMPGMPGMSMPSNNGTSPAPPEADKK